MNSMGLTQSFDETVDQYGGHAAFDIILVQDCSVLDNTAKASLDQAYNARLCSAEEDSALLDVRDLLCSKGFNSVEVGLLTTGAQILPQSAKSASEIYSNYADPELSERAREAYIATLRRIARGIDVDAKLVNCRQKSLPQSALPTTKSSFLW
jgi:hypothetical protein